MTTSLVDIMVMAQSQIYIKKGLSPELPFVKCYNISLKELFLSHHVLVAEAVSGRTV